MGRAEDSPGVTAPASIAVEVVYCAAPGECDRVALRLPEGACVADALRASGLVARHRLDESVLKVGVWAKLREPDAPLRDRDRVEIYRPLTVDPKEARRQRYRRDRTARGRAPAVSGG